MESKIYKKGNNLSALKLLRNSLIDIYSSRFLARQFAERDIKAQYRQSYLGILWAFIPPLATAFVWVFLNSTGTVKLSETGIPYPLYAFTGTLIWSIIVSAINTPLQSTNAARGIMTKINFPKEALIISGIYKLLFNSAIKILLLLLFVIFYGVGFNWSLLLLPFAIFGAILFGITIGVLIAPIGLLYTDVKRLISFGMQFLMYITPVVYAIPQKGLMNIFMTWNPITPMILTTRDLIVGVNSGYLSYFFIVLACSIPFLLIGLIFYRISIPIIVERLSA
ncbi:ABC transporter permease [Flavivirga abyssicola]|uniref:ABC transporter permease n=1 Tax=Flavivirga abyssicola TaxID=3063533 RepID=UPI0026DEFE17|nr:ABC transporter permease [Flavivirga sp. MEBiC07777]WVK13653.1 ABC transporter permease [Flavivirga sp. MEBiC07777]